MADHPGNVGLGKRAARQSKRRARRAVAWLAIVGLLIQALSPVTFATSARAGEPGPGVSFCGHRSHDRVPAGGVPLVPEHCCPLCCAVATGPVPVPDYAFAAPVRFAAIRRPALRTLAVVARSSVKPAQARAPPPAV
jgi:hypothetical protein